MDEFCDNYTSEDINSSKRKRQKIDPSHWKILTEEIEETEFFEQMGIGMLDSDESSSLDYQDTYESQISNYDKDVSTILTKDADTDENDTNKNVKNSNFKGFSEKEQINSTIGNSSNIEIYTDVVNEPTPGTGRPIRNANLAKVITTSNAKKRSPLTTVSNNNIHASIDNPTVSKMLMNLVSEENFFLYKKEHIQNDDQPNYFDHLADEVILSIFKWLPKKALVRCSSVSKQFNRVSQDESLWTRLDLGSKYLRSQALTSILSKGVVILRLAQSEISDPIFDLERLNFDIKLQYLDLSMSVISKQSLQLLLSKCRNLNKLSLEHVTIDNAICLEISENKKIEALNLTMCEGINAEGLLAIMKELKYLKSINVSWTSLTMESVKIFVENITPNILQLNIAGCRKTISNQYVSILIERCPDLLELDLSDCTSLTSNVITTICKLKKLEYLSLSRCYNINVNSYFSLSNLKSLLYLDVFGLMNEQATQMLQSSLINVGINKFIHSSVARPTVGTRRTSIWGLRTRD